MEENQVAILINKFAEIKRRIKIKYRAAVRVSDCCLVSRITRMRRNVKGGGLAAVHWSAASGGAKTLEIQEQPRYTKAPP